MHRPALIALALTAAGPTLAQSVPLAFPGAEGAGAHALGGRGGRVFTVTTLADSGRGSLREAVESKGPRTIVFAVAGTIRLAKPLKIVEPRITIAGQTAPGGGITLRDQPLLVAADDVVIRFIRARLGDVSHVESDAVSVVAGRRIILDHVSASWSVDETLSVGAPGKDPERVVRDVTVQWSIIGESLNRSGHAKGAHGYGSLLRSGFGARISFHHNLWAHHRARMPRPGNYNDPDIDPEGAVFDIRANIFYNWAGGHAGYNADKVSRSTYNFVGNLYLRGPASKGGIAFDEASAGGRGWFAGNRMDGQLPADPWSLVTGLTGPENRLTAPAEAPPVAEDASAFDRVLASAGASLWRDSVDTRIVDSVRSRGGALIDSQAQVGGWPDLPVGKAANDRDGDGMPDAWERANGLNPSNPADGAADRNRDGVTNLEDWLAEAAAGKR